MHLNEKVRVTSATSIKSHSGTLHTYIFVVYRMYVKGDTDTGH